MSKNSVTISNSCDTQSGDTAIMVDTQVDGRTTTLSRVTFNGETLKVTHAHYITGGGMRIVVSEGSGFPKSGPLTAKTIGDAKFWKRNTITRVYS
jgi:hypothetical protein